MMSYSKLPLSFRSRFRRSGYFLLVFIACSVFWISCVGEKEVVPRTNPRFSIALVQNINENGAEFAADMIDYGSEEILEYGFVFGAEARLTDPDAQFVSAMGSPERQFRFRVERGLSVGINYAVRAFLKIPSGVVYSDAVEFISLGSRGFELQEVIHNPQVYFGDTLEFRGINLFDPATTTISVSFEGADVSAFDVKETGFKIKIPKTFSYSAQSFLDRVFRIEILVGEKAFLLNQTLDFKDATFAPLKTQQYRDTWVLEGEYLFSQQISLGYRNRLGQFVEFEIQTAEDQSIAFVPRAFFTENVPQLELKVREKTYLIQPFEIAPTDLEEGQEIRRKIFSGGIVKGSNFNYLIDEPSHLIVDFQDRLELGVFVQSSDEVSFSLLPKGALPSREIKIHANNFGEKSAQFATYIYEGAEWILSDLPDGLRTSRVQYGGDFNDRGYVFTDKAVFEIQPEIRSIQQVATFNLDFGTESGFLLNDKEKFYFSVSDPFPFRTDVPLYEFDANSREIKRISTLPKNGEVKGSFFLNGKLHVFLRTYEEGNSSSAVLRFDPETKVWDERNSGEERDVIGEFVSFDFEGEAYSFGQILYQNQLRIGVFRWNDDLTPELVFPMEHFPLRGNAKVIGNRVYFVANNSSIVEVDMTLQTSRVSTTRVFPLFSLFKSGQFLYYTSSGDNPFLFEFNLDYF